MLELLHQLVQPLEVLLLLLPGELQLLDLPVSPQGSLVSLTRSVSSFIIPMHVVVYFVPDLASPQLRLQHPDLLLQLSNHLPPVAGRRGLGVLQPLLQLVALGEGGLASNIF